MPKPTTARPKQPPRTGKTQCPNTDAVARYASFLQDDCQDERQFGFGDLDTIRHHVRACARCRAILIAVWETNRTWAISVPRHSHTTTRAFLQQSAWWTLVIVAPIAVAVSLFVLARELLESS